MLTVANKSTMSHIEIAKLVGSRPDKVKQSMERLSDKGVIQLTPMGEVNHLGQSVVNYHVSERDSYIVVAQLSPEFTAFLVDEWQKRKAQPLLTQEQQVLAIAHQLIKTTAERDEAIKTKAYISDKRTATLMNKASQDSKRIKSLEAKIQSEGNYRSILAAELPQRVDTESKKNVQSFRILIDISSKMNLPPKKVEDQRYGNVNTYHVDVIAEFEKLYM